MLRVAGSESGDRLRMWVWGILEGNGNGNGGGGDIRARITRRIERGEKNS